MIRILLVWLINAVSVYATASFISGIHVQSFWAALIVDLVLGLINAVIKPILVFFSIPFIVLTLGLFLLIINAGMLYLASLFVSGFSVDGFWPAIFGSIVISMISWLLSTILRVN